MLVGCAAQQGGVPNSAKVVEVAGGECVGSSACKYQSEWQSAKCAEMPIAGIALERCWMTQRFLFNTSERQDFEVYSSDTGGSNVLLFRTEGYGVRFSQGSSAATLAGSFSVVRLDGRAVRTSNLKLVRDDGGGSFAFSFDAPGQSCQAYFRDGRRAGDRPNLLLRVIYTVCKKTGETVSPDEVMALVGKVKIY
jgi:hypothetical protein